MAVMDGQVQIGAAERVRKRFREVFGKDAAGVVRAPGRVNLIGEHTDYNDGFVMPAAIDLYVWVAYGPRPDRTLSAVAENLNETAEIDLDNNPPEPKHHWTDYVRGIAGVLGRKHKLKGANVVIYGEVPFGSGLSSSAAIEVSTGLAMLRNSGVEMTPTDLALAGQKAEHEYVGTMSGIMDQFISANGKQDHCILLDCRSLRFDALPIPHGMNLVICNTMVKHDLATGEYNTRRKECEEGVRLLQRWFPNIKALRDVTLHQLQQHGRALPDTIYKRCHHVVSENDRTANAARALRRGDLKEFGRLMAASHVSLRDDYEVSCAELDTMVELANEVEGTIGARMTGGGFGGCTINLVSAEATDRFREHVAPRYKERTGLDPQIYVQVASEGAGVVNG